MSATGPIGHDEGVREHGMDISRSRWPKRDVGVSRKLIQLLVHLRPYGAKSKRSETRMDLEGCACKVGA